MVSGAATDMFIRRVVLIADVWFLLSRLITLPYSVQRLCPSALKRHLNISFHKIRALNSDPPDLFVNVNTQWRC